MAKKKDVRKSVAKASVKTVRPAAVKKAAPAKKKVSSKKQPSAKKPAAVKKAPAKKPAVKKVAPAKKPAVKKVAAVKKTPVKKVSATKAKPVAVKAPPSKKAGKTEIKRVPPRITRKPTPVKPSSGEYVPVDTAKAVAFAMSIAEEMKRTAAKEDFIRGQAEIKLSRRPVTRAQGKRTEKFPASDLKEFKRRLIEARQRALNGVLAMKATGFNESEDHEADGGDGTNQTLRLQALGHMGSINRVIQQIDEALHRIGDGSYGVCTSCGQLIRKPRLLNQPFVLTCMECQSEMERSSR